MKCIKILVSEGKKEGPFKRKCEKNVKYALRKQNIRAWTRFKLFPVRSNSGLS
jgi:hypothetical protein